MVMKVPNKNRVTTGVMGTSSDNGNNGVFRFTRRKYVLRVIASDGMGWEHVSVTRSDQKMPTWTDMCYIKDKFWDTTDTVIQLHVPQDDWISNHNKCLHLWRQINVCIPLPPSAMVGIKGASQQDIKTAVKRLYE